MKLHIDSDGTLAGTFVKDADGNVIEGIFGLTFSISQDRQHSTVRLELQDMTMILNCESKASLPL